MRLPCALSLFNWPSSAQLRCKAYQKARQRKGMFASLFEFARSLLQLFVWDNVYQLWMFVHDKESQAAPTQTAWNTN